MTRLLLTCFATLILAACAPMTQRQTAELTQQWAGTHRTVVQVRHTALCARYPSGEVSCE